MLGNSPWSARVGATFALAEQLREPDRPTLPGAPEAGVAGPKSSAGRWDGGVDRPDRNLPPTLTVTVTWESALPIREALAQVKGAHIVTSEDAAKNYVVAVSGLIPANANISPGLPGSDSSGASPTTPEQMLEGVMQYSHLFPRGQSPINASDAKLDRDGTLRIFFERTRPITSADKDVLFETRYGLLSVTKKFKLKDMLYGGHLEL